MKIDEFKKRILEASNENELIDTLFDSPIEFLVDLKYWNNEMILNVSKIANISKEEVREIITNGDFFLMKENYDEENENL